MRSFLRFATLAVLSVAIGLVGGNPHLVRSSPVSTLPELPTFGVPEPVVEVNSPAIDDGPALSADGLTLYFSSDRPGGSGFPDVWQASRLTPTSRFGIPSPLDEINSTTNDGHPAPFADGLTLFFDYSLEIDRAIWSPDAETWSKAGRVLGDEFSGWNSGASVKADGTVMVFFSDQPGHQPPENLGRQGQLDLWEARSAGPGLAYTTIVSLTAVNTGYWEAHPSITPDGLTLYFESRRPEFEGDTVEDTNIWVARRENLDSPFEDVRLVPNVNGPADDGNPSISFDGQQLYFVSDRDGDAANIWVATVEGMESTPPVIVPHLDPAPNSAGWNNGQVTLSWSVSDPQTGISSSLGCKTKTVNYNTPGKSFTCTATNGAGLRASVTMIVKLDAVSPGIWAWPSRSPDSNGWYNHPVSMTWLLRDSPSDLASGLDTCDGVGEHGGPVGSQITCSDRAGNVTPSGYSLLYDPAPPTITYQGNAGTYTVHETVSITCSAQDSLSGLASAACTGASGPAYTFDIGANTLSSTATDVAGNVGSGSTTFAVRVTYESLCLLTHDFDTSPRVAQALCGHLDTAREAEVQGDTQAKARALGIYKNRVAAQIGRTLTSEQAGTLTRLADVLAQP